MASNSECCPSVHEKMDIRITRIKFLKKLPTTIGEYSPKESKLWLKILFREQSTLLKDCAGYCYKLLDSSNLDEYYTHISLCNTAGVYAFKLGMFKTGVELLSLGLKLIEENKINESSLMGSLENNIGCAQSMMGNYDSALKNFERADKYMKRTNKTRDSFKVKINVAYTLMKLEKYSKAEFYLTELYSESRCYEIVDNDVNAGSRSRGEGSRDKPKETIPIDKESRENSFSVFDALCPERFKQISRTKEGQLLEENARTKIDWLTPAVIALNYARVLNHLVKHDKAVEILRDLLMRIKPWLVINTSLSITIQAIMIQSLTQMGRLAEASMIFESGQLEIALINTSLDEQSFRPSLLCVVEDVVRALVCLGERTLSRKMLEKAANLSREIYGMDHPLTQGFANTANELCPVKDHIQTRKVITLKDLQEQPLRIVITMFDCCRAGYPSITGGDLIEMRPNFPPAIGMESVEMKITHEFLDVSLKNTLCTSIYIITQDFSGADELVARNYLPQEVQSKPITEVYHIIHLCILLEAFLYVESSTTVTLICQTLSDVLSQIKNMERNRNQQSIEIYKDVQGLVSFFVSYREVPVDGTQKSLCTIVTCGRQPKDDVIGQDKEKPLFKTTALESSLKSIKGPAGFGKSLCAFVVLRAVSLVDISDLRMADVHVVKSLSYRAVHRSLVIEIMLTCSILPMFFLNLDLIKVLVRTETVNGKSTRFYLHEYQRCLMFDTKTEPAVLSAALHHQFRRQVIAEEVYKSSKGDVFYFTDPKHGVLTLSSQDETLWLNVKFLSQSHLVSDVILNDITNICDDVIKKCSEFFEVFPKWEKSWHEVEAGTAECSEVETVEEKLETALEANAKLLKEKEYFKNKTVELAKKCEELQEDLTSVQVQLTFSQNDEAQAKWKDHKSWVTTSQDEQDGVTYIDKVKDHRSCVTTIQDEQDGVTYNDSVADSPLCSHEYEQTRSLSVGCENKYPQDTSVGSIDEKHLRELGGVEFQRERAERKLHKFVGVQQEILYFKKRNPTQGTHQVEDAARGTSESLGTSTNLKESTSGQGASDEVLVSNTRKHQNKVDFTKSFHWKPNVEDERRDGNDTSIETTSYCLPQTGGKDTTLAASSVERAKKLSPSTEAISTKNSATKTVQLQDEHLLHRKHDLTSKTDAFLLYSKCDSTSSKKEQRQDQLLPQRINDSTLNQRAEAIKRNSQSQRRFQDIIKGDPVLTCADGPLKGNSDYALSKYDAKSTIQMSNTSEASVQNQSKGQDSPTTEEQRKKLPTMSWSCSPTTVYGEIYKVPDNSDKDMQKTTYDQVGNTNTKGQYFNSVVDGSDNKRSSVDTKASQERLNTGAVPKKNLAQEKTKDNDDKAMELQLQHTKQSRTPRIPRAKTKGANNYLSCVENVVADGSPQVNMTKNEPKVTVIERVKNKSESEKAEKVVGDGTKASVVKDAEKIEADGRPLVNMPKTNFPVTEPIIQNNNPKSSEKVSFDGTKANQAKRKLVISNENVVADSCPKTSAKFTAAKPAVQMYKPERSEVVRSAENDAANSHPIKKMQINIPEVIIAKTTENKDVLKETGVIDDLPKSSEARSAGNDITARKSFLETEDKTYHVISRSLSTDSDPNVNKPTKQDEKKHSLPSPQISHESNNGQSLVQKNKSLSDEAKSCSDSQNTNHKNTPHLLEMETSISEKPDFTDSDVVSSEVESSCSGDQDKNQQNTPHLLEMEDPNYGQSTSALPENVSTSNERITCSGGQEQTNIPALNASEESHDELSNRETESPKNITQNLNERKSVRIEQRNDNVTDVLVHDASSGSLIQVQAGYGKSSFAHQFSKLSQTTKKLEPPENTPSSKYVNHYGLGQTECKTRPIAVQRDVNNRYKGKSGVVIAGHNSLHTDKTTFYNEVDGQGLTTSVTTPSNFALKDRTMKVSNEGQGTCSSPTTTGNIDLKERIFKTNSKSNYLTKQPRELHGYLSLPSQQKIYQSNHQKKTSPMDQSYHNYSGVVENEYHKINPICEDSDEDKDSLMTFDSNRLVPGYSNGNSLGSNGNLLNAGYSNGNRLDTVYLNRNPSDTGYSNGNRLGAGYSQGNQVVSWPLGVKSSFLSRHSNDWRKRVGHSEYIDRYQSLPLLTSPQYYHHHNSHVEDSTLQQNYDETVDPSLVKISSTSPSNATDSFSSRNTINDERITANAISPNVPASSTETAEQSSFKNYLTGTSNDTDRFSAHTSSRNTVNDEQITADAIPPNVPASSTETSEQSFKISSTGASNVPASSTQTEDKSSNETTSIDTFNSFDSFVSCSSTQGAEKEDRCENTSPSSSVQPNTGGEVHSKRPSLGELINTNTMVNSATYSKTLGQYTQDESRPTDSLEESFHYMPSRTSPSKLQLTNETENETEYELFEATSNDTVAAAAASSSTLSCEAMTDDTIESLKESVSQYKDTFSTLMTESFYEMDHHLREAVKKERELKRKREKEEIEKLIEKRRQKASEQTVTTPRPASLPVQESDDAIVSCAHFKRGCDILFTCCNKYYQCHRCHNNSDLCEINDIKASDATHLRCRTCMTVQEITPTSTHCNNCKKKLSEYFCAICKHYTADDKKPYHCDPCGICRIHRDNSFHCDVCNVCLNRRLQGKHKCRPDSGHDECCICLEDAFSGCQVLPCSHKVHRECAVAMIKNGVRKCPICRSPIYQD